MIPILIFVFLSQCHEGFIILQLPQLREPLECEKQNQQSNMVTSQYLRCAVELFCCEYMYLVPLH